jgi:hypothetical protein
VFVVFAHLLAPTADTQIARGPLHSAAPRCSFGWQGRTDGQSIRHAENRADPPADGRSEDRDRATGRRGFGTAGTVGTPVATLELNAVTAEGLHYNRSWRTRITK